MSSTHHTMPRDSRAARLRLSPRRLSVRRLSLRAVAWSVIGLGMGLAMMAAAIIVIVGERGGGISLPLWNIAVEACQGVTGLLGVCVLVSPLFTRGSESSRQETLSTVASGAALIGAAVIPVGFVIVVTGLFGLGLAAAGVATVAGAYVGSARPTR